MSFETEPGITSVSSGSGIFMRDCYPQNGELLI